MMYRCALREAEPDDAGKIDKLTSSFLNSFAVLKTVGKENNWTKKHKINFYKQMSREN